MKWDIIADRFSDAVIEKNDARIIYYIKKIDLIGIPDDDTTTKRLFRTQKERLIKEKSRY